MSFLQRLSIEAENTYQDVYSNWILGDDAGKSAYVTLILRTEQQQQQQIRQYHQAQQPFHHNQYISSPLSSPIGMTFIEVNGRAYVYSVIEGSLADQNGVLPHDAVQFAAVVRPEWVSQSVDNNKKEYCHNSSTSNNESSSSSANDNDEVSLAVKYATDLEQKGARIGYDELRHLLLHKAMIKQTYVHSAFLSPPCNNNGMSASNSSTWNGPPVPSNVCVPIRVGHCHPEEEDATMSDESMTGGNNNNEIIAGNVSTSNDNNNGLPVVFVFRRTRQRKSFSHMGLMPALRLDDECDLASSLVRRLAPSNDMDIPHPELWDELVNDGTDWLLGSGSILPPMGEENVKPQVRRRTKKHNKMIVLEDRNYCSQPEVVPTSSSSSDNSDENHDEDDELSRIPLDDFEKDRAQKLTILRSRMALEALHVDRSEDVEAATIRGMIQKAVGLAFIRANKIVLGISVHVGSGIVIARLSDGTWSAPSAIGTWGLGLGLQFGLEVAEYIFILQTEEALEHFRKGASYTVGGNMGLAFAGLGREAYGAASVGGSVCGSVSNVNDDEDNYNDNDSRNVPQRRQIGPAIAPIVAYAKSQGLYVGVSLEGSRIFPRDDINSRVYKFATLGRDVCTSDLLTGKVPTPPEAEGLYAALHSVEFAHEMSCLPRPPEILRRDASNDWQFDRCTLGLQCNSNESGYTKQKQPFSFLSNITSDEKEQLETFEAQFKNFLYGGVSVQRLLTDENCCDNSSTSVGKTRHSRKRKTGKERRTLWLMLPEVGSLRLGFVSKLSDGDGVPVSNMNSTRQARRADRTRTSAFDGNGTDLVTVGSEELTLDSALRTRDGSTCGPKRVGNVQLSDKHSVALTDITSVSHEPAVPVSLRGDDKTERLRVISIQDVAGTSILFLTNNFKEAELLMCGLKLLLERETARLGVRGGLPITALGGKSREGIMSPAAARGFREIPSKAKTSPQRNTTRHWRTDQSTSHHVNNNQLSPTSLPGDESMASETESTTNELPAGRQNWGKIPGRNYMRDQAEAFADSLENGMSSNNEQAVSKKYIHGQLIRRSIFRHVQLPIPFTLARTFLLDSTSSVIQKWENGRGDKNFEKTSWTFPLSVSKEHSKRSSEYELVTSGSMSSAHRTISFDRPRYGSVVRLSEIHTVETDDPTKVIYAIFEQNPRRGFSINVRIFLKEFSDSTSEATVYADVRPVGKDMSNQEAVHKAYNLVIEELRMRYGLQDNGLLACLCSDADQTMLNTMPRMANPMSHTFGRAYPSTSRESVANNANKPQSGFVSLADILKTGRDSPETAPIDRPLTPNIFADVPQPNPSLCVLDRVEANAIEGPDICMVPYDERLEKKKEPVMIEVKPLPKIRLSLMPAPREEDEYDSDSASPTPAKPVKKKKKKSSHSDRKSASNMQSSRRSK